MTARSRERPTRKLIYPGSQTTIRHARLQVHCQRRRTGLEALRFPHRRFQLDSESVGFDHKRFPTIAGALRIAERPLPLESATHAHTDMSTTSTPSVSRTALKPETASQFDGPSPTPPMCPTDGQLLGSQHQIADNLFECPHCRQRWRSEEVR